MKKYLKKGIVVAIVGMMTFGMGTSVFAEETDGNGLNTISTNPSDTSTITLQKDYVNGLETQQNTKSPKEDFIFKIDRYGLWNVGENGKGVPKYDITNMPTFSNGSATDTFTIHANKGAAGKTSTNKPSVKLQVPTYKAVGDYWYKVTETDNNTAGVFYGTNDSKSEDETKPNGAHQGVYYIHVQVTNAETGTSYVRTVTLHKTAPGTNVTNADYETWYTSNYMNTDGQNDKKVADIQNKYYAGSLNIKKEVTGNAGDKNELFKVTVTFKNESKANMKSDITYKNFYNKDGKQTTAATPLSWTDIVGTSGTATTHTSEPKEVEFYVKDDTTVTFANIPYGVTYEITETQPEDDKYTHTFEHTNEDREKHFDGVMLAADAATNEGTSKTATEKWNAAKATGSISDESDTVTITNDKTSAIDIGVITSDAPYVAWLLLIGIVVVVFIRKKSMIEE